MSKKSRIVILCEAYGSIDYPLYVLENEKVDVPVTIFITALKDLYLLFQALNEKVLNNSLELVYYPPFISKWSKMKGIKRWLYILPDILRERRHLKQFYNRHFARLEDATIIFSSPGYSGVKIYVLRRLSKRNRLVYISHGPPYMGKYTPANIVDLVKLLIYIIMKIMIFWLFLMPI